jgi:DNA sulfur modification protein DndD
VIIKSIEIINFLSYFDRTIFNFDEGATLIIGQNNTGKSKLFDAYNWVLYDEAYQTAAEDWSGTNVWKSELANRYAKKMCPVNSTIEVSVCLSFSDEEFNLYIVTREYKIQKINNTEWSCPTTSEIAVTRTNASTFDTTNFMGTEANELLNTYFPKNLSRYFLFQGEGISKLLRLNQRSDFTRAIGELSGIKFFDKARRYANKVYERTKAEFENKIDNDKTIQDEKIKLVNEINSSRQRVTDLDSKLENEFKERDIKQRKLEEKVEELSRYEECAKLLQEIKSLEQQRDEKREERKKLFEYARPSALGHWMYKRVESLYDNFLILYRNAKAEKKIPEPIRQDFIKEMLHDYMCKVCGTEAPAGSLQYNHILSFLNEKSLDNEIAIINNLSDAADSMKSALTQVPEKIEDFKNDLNRYQVEIDKIKNKIGFKEDELRIVTERIEEEKKTKINRKDLERINLVQLKRDRDQIKIDLDQSKTKIDQLVGRKDEAEKILRNFELSYQAIIDKSSNDLERNRMKFAEEIRDQVSQLHDNFLTKLINDIEEEADSYFNNMTKANPALSGKVRIDYDNREVYTVDESGQPMANINQANKVSLQISFVAAVLSVSNKIWEKHFPFVADAPISALGGNNKINAIKTIIDIFRQSIVILKDDADLDNEESIKNDLVRQLIQKNQKILNAYELRMEGSKIEDQKTKMSKLK